LRCGTALTADDYGIQLQNHNFKYAIHHFGTLSTLCGPPTEMMSTSANEICKYAPVSAMQVVHTHSDGMRVK